MNKKIFLSLIGFLFNLINCAGIYNEPVFINKQKTNSIHKKHSLRIHWILFL
jgi:hypothetical protein